jgi:ribosomal protein L29
MSKKTNFTNHTPEDLVKFVADKRDSLRTLRFAGAGSKNHNVKEARTIRKDIARALTETTARRATALSVNNAAAK